MRRGGLGELPIFRLSHLQFAIALLQLSICSSLFAAEPILTGGDVPWQLADPRTVLVLRLDPARVTGEDLRAAGQAALGEDSLDVQAWLDQADSWLRRLEQAGVERIYIGLGAPVDADGEETDPPMWAAVRHRPGSVEPVADAISQFGQVAGSPLIAEPSAGRWIAVLEEGKKLHRGPPLAPEHRVDLELALGEARGTALSGALVLPSDMRRELAKFLGEMGEADPGFRPIFKQLSTAAEHWRYATGGLWLGASPTIRVEFVFDDPQGAADLAGGVEQLRAYVGRLIEIAPAEPAKSRAMLEAIRELCRVRHADRSAVWEIEPERMSLLRPALEGLTAPRVEPPARDR